MFIQIKNLIYSKPTEPYQVFVCRGKSPLGNPFILTDENDDKERDRVCDSYDRWLHNELSYLGLLFNDQENEMIRLYKIYQEYGKLELFCFCAPKRCHAESIVIKLTRLKQFIKEGKVII